MEPSERGRGEAEARREQRPWRWERWGWGVPWGCGDEPAAQAEEEHVCADLREGEARARGHSVTHPPSLAP